MCDWIIVLIGTAVWFSLGYIVGSMISYKSCEKYEKIKKYKDSAEIKLIITLLTKFINPGYAVLSSEANLALSIQREGCPVYEKLMEEMGKRLDEGAKRVLCEYEKSNG